jgi:lysophospholipase L1-like esterase
MLLGCALALALGLSACGGSSGESPREEVELGAGAQKTGPARSGANTTVVAALGDSITAGSPLFDPDPVVRAQIGSQLDPESQYGYWAQLRLKGTRFRNCGVFGERTDEIAARLDSCAEGAQVLIVQGGINDIAQMRRIKPAAKNLRSMVMAGKKKGLRVALVEVLPWNNGYPGAAGQIKRLNKRIHAIGRDHSVPVFPWYTRLEDPERPGYMKAEWTIDGNHPSVAGYRRLAGVVELP